MANVIGEPRVVEAGRGASWWGEAWHIFTSNFWTWIGIMIVYIVITMLIGLVPYVGRFGTWLLTPVFIGGLMLGCQAIDRDEPLRVAHLFEGFQGAHFVPLMIIGAVNLAIVVITALAITAATDGFSLAILMQAGAMDDPLGAFGEMASAFTGTVLLLVLIAIVVAAIYIMLNWFAPALVALEGATAIEAMKLSFLSSLRNWVPFLVYGLIGIGVLIAAALVFGGLTLLFGAGAIMALVSGGSAMSAGGGFGALVGVGLLFIVATAIFALVVPPIWFGSQYAGYKDTLAVEEWINTNIALGPTTTAPNRF